MCDTHACTSTHVFTIRLSKKKDSQNLPTFCLGHIWKHLLRSPFFLSSEWEVTCNRPGSFLHLLRTLADVVDDNMARHQLGQQLSPVRKLQKRRSNSLLSLSTPEQVNALRHSPSIPPARAAWAHWTDPRRFRRPGRLQVGSSAGTPLPHPAPLPRLMPPSCTHTGTTQQQQHNGLATPSKAAEPRTCPGPVPWRCSRTSTSRGRWEKLLCEPPSAVPTCFYQLPLIVVGAALP